jgi:hypothetical protein
MQTLASGDDIMWPHEHWPAMRLSKGLLSGSTGGHGPIGYSVREIVPGKMIRFDFTRPKGFKGYHYFEIVPLRPHTSVVKHVIYMRVQGLDILKWLLAIRWLHNALIEDALDKLESHFSLGQKLHRWSLWVRLWRYILKSKN